jgi:undecaprenyl-diphosphatase
LIVTQNLLDFTGPKENAFIVFIQLGAISAVLWMYRRKIFDMLIHWRTAPDLKNLMINLFIGTLPAVAVGLPTEHWIEAHLFKPGPVALALIAGGVAILLIERRAVPPQVNHMDQISAKNAFGVGLIQVLAILFPGISRSGATIMGGMVLGLSRTAATEFSFFLAIPAMFGASIIKMFGVRKIVTAADLPLFGFGFVVSFIVALIVIRQLVAFVSRRDFKTFAWYRIVCGSALLGLMFFNGNILSKGM